MNAERHSIYSPKEEPPKGQAAYFNYLNTYKPNVPNFNGEHQYIVLNNDFDTEYAPSQSNQFNGPFNIPNSDQFEHFHHGNQQNLPNNGQNSFVNSPFSGINLTPSFIPVPPQLLAKNSKSHSTKRMQMSNKSDDSET